jgi:hypothetical protein
MALTKEQIANALERKAGNVTEAAKALKVTRQALHLHIKDDEDLQTIVTQARESLVDIAESSLLKQIKEGNTAAIIFTLKTQGKARGYVERQEISGPDGGPIVVKGYATVTPDDWNDTED